MLKRIFDLLISAIGLISLCPILIIFCLLIFLQDFKSPFYFGKRVGINYKVFYMLKLRSMKVGSDNYRESAVLFLIDALQDSDFELIIYEPKMDQDSYKGIPLLKNLEDFISRSDMIVANRLSDELSPVHHKIFSRDLFTRDV